ncbi:carbamoyl phosphate synthase small subunit [Anoxybacter fermentans]|uniref:Carbamoyl phosphate synthase small chain n=1 Tax=Anoxybacter fermentans TaxID=1323375 RepID=A0A3S9SXN4_9FIRM|nr:glutamine-hydrolyzing carbamoyl-phosphate synthase small subunit [Anoxybacter fermentans]AZR73008.1 carbamoyl phosphate synthase small subunit [Anoxybacter fermentans]
MKASLILEDGTVFHGKGIGIKGETIGEVVFNTGMTGYQEILTDPSYYGQIITFTYPLIGNYGVNDSSQESNKIQVKGIIAREITNHYSNWQAKSSLQQYLVKNQVIGIEQIDTRALVKKLREKGTMFGVIVNGQWVSSNIEKYLIKIRAFQMDENPVAQVTTKKPHVIKGEGKRIAVLDFGVKSNIIRNLKALNCKIFIFPAWTDPEVVLAMKPDGLVLSNGPGDPAKLPYVENIKSLIGRVPIFGICLGHQLTALAFGAKTYKLKYGHRGVNHPIKDLRTQKVYITSQNHGYVVDAKTLPRSAKITHINLNDNTIEGLSYPDYNIQTVQYHPEAAPGPYDSNYLFKAFIDFTAKS